MKPQLASYLCLVYAAATFAVPSAYAQSSEQKVQEYRPPPLFGAPSTAQPRPPGQLIIPGKTSDVPAIYSPEPSMPPNAAQAPVYVKPRISRSNEDKPINIEPYIPKFPPMEPVPMEQTPRGRGLIVDRPAGPMDAPLPAHKPAAPPAALSQSSSAVPVPSSPTPPTPPNGAPEAPAPAAEKLQPPVAAPVSIIRATMPAAPPPEAPATPEKQTEPVVTGTPAAPPAVAPALEKAVQEAMPVPAEASPAQRVTSKGVVTGPKTMPTAPTSQVEKETTYIPQAADGALLEQHVTRQIMNPESGIDAPAPLGPVIPANFVPLATLKSLSSQKSALSLQFTPGSSVLSTEQTLTIADQILPVLRENPGTRVQIQAYATPTDASQNSDRRAALSRALAFRSTLMEQGIAARRIDVRALGADPAGTASDRVDLVLSGLPVTP